MRKNFNSVQMLKSSKIKNKFSKSVSFETLVGGTATTGTRIKQTQRLFLSSADKPLSAVGTLTSLLCNFVKVKAPSLLSRCCASANQGISTSASCREAHKRRFLFNLIRKSLEKFFKKNFRDDSSCFGFAKVLSFALVFTLITISESRAEDVIPTSGTCNSTGTCLWNLDESGKLSISGSGSIDTYVTTKDSQFFEENQPWKELKDKITSVDIQGVNNISFALFRSYNNITDVNIGDSVKKIGGRAFDHNYLKTVIIPASVTYVGVDAFRTLTSKDVIFFDNESMQTWHTDAFNDRGGPKDTYYCFGNIDSCSDKLKKFVDVSSGGNCNSTGCAIIKAIKVATEDQCKGNYYWSGTSCNNKKSGIKCDENWKRNEDFCNRIRYTPAEAAKVLHDDNTNEVTITFKK